MHQMVLDRFRQVEGDQDPAFTNGQFAQCAHLPNSHVPPAATRNTKIRPEWSYFSIRPNGVWPQSGFSGIFGLGIPMIRPLGRGIDGWPTSPSLAPWRTLCSIHRNDDLVVAARIFLKVIHITVGMSIRCECEAATEQR